MAPESIIAIAEVFANKAALFLPVEEVYLYGSYAKGDQKKDSDIDLAVVVEKLEGDFLQAEARLFKLRRETDDRIEPLLIERSHDPSGFLSDIRSYGQSVYHAHV
jgi:predicted nucleotidyltransferase